MPATGGGYVPCTNVLLLTFLLEQENMLLVPIQPTLRHQVLISFLTRRLPDSNFRPLVVVAPVHGRHSIFVQAVSLLHAGN